MSPSVAEKLLEWERRREDGTPVTPEELCADSPELVDEVRHRIRRLQECDRVLGLDETETALGPTEPGQEIPSRIAEFDIRGRLGHGGMGDVYDAWDPALQREVAIKVVRLPADFWPFARSRELTARFSREGAALARLEHPYIVPVYQAGLWEDRPYIVMARVGGGSLADHMENMSGLGPRAIAAFAEKIARAVHAAHEQGVLHRDLKPANILIDAKGDPRVGDFGLAKFWTPAESADGAGPAVAERPAELSVPGCTPGTPAYMSPEQFDPRIGKVSPASDVWALGIVLYELLTGERPFTGDTHQRLREKVCRLPAPTCRVKGRSVPRWLDAIVARCLQKAPADRYRSAAELAGALRAGLQRRRRTLWVLGGAAALALLLGVGIIGGRWVFGSTPETRFEDRPEVIAAMERLAKGQEVVLVDRDRRAPFNPLFGAETCRIVESDPTVLTLHSRWSGPGTAEFLPVLPPGRYRVRAVIRHDDAYVHSKIALYVGGRHWQSGQGNHLGCVALDFKDAGPDAEKPPDADLFASLHCLLTGEVQGRPDHDNMEEPAKLRYPPIPANQVRPYRTLELLVTEAAVEAWWDGQRVGTVSLEMAARRQANYLSEYPELRPAENDPHPFRGGIGLIVYNGTISVTDFRVTPRN